MSPASKETWQCRQLASQACPHSFAQSLAARRFGLQRDLDDGFLRPAGEQMDQVYRVAGRNHAHEIAGDPDVVRAGLARDDVERMQHDALGFFDARAGGARRRMR